MSESLFENNDGVIWHNHDIYEGAGGETRHAHRSGDEDHVHDFSQAIPITEERDTFAQEAARLRAINSQSHDLGDATAPTLRETPDGCEVVSFVQSRQKAQTEVARIVRRNRQGSRRRIMWRQLHNRR